MGSALVFEGQLADAFPALTGPKTGALSVIDRWTTAFASQDLDAIVRLYAHDAVFVGTGSTKLVRETKGIRDYFAKAFTDLRPVSMALNDFDSPVLTGPTVVFTAIDEIKGSSARGRLKTKGRVTFVVAKRQGEWKIVHFHRSEMPK